MAAPVQGVPVAQAAMVAQPVQQQPVQQIVLPEGCPPGLAYLIPATEIRVKQQLEMLEVLSGFETANKYLVTNDRNEQIYFATEDTDCCTRQCCGAARPFEMNILDNGGQEIMHLSRPYRCSGGCPCDCCLHELSVFSPVGSQLGRVKQMFSCCEPKIRIEPTDGDVGEPLIITGPCCQCRCCSDIIFHVTQGGVEIGAITKKFGGVLKESFTDADSFSVTFPVELAWNLKALLFGAVFLVDFMFFETNNN